MNNSNEPLEYEHGSEFHWPTSLEGERGWWPSGAQYYGSGRDAMRALFEFGRARLGWKRLYIPSYFCPEVSAALLDTGLDVTVYPDNPTLPSPNFAQSDLAPGDVYLLVNYFGLRTHIDSSLLRQAGVVVVEDHTHDPWSDWAQHSRADYCLASLRKNLPVPDGAMLWSPQNLALPELPELTDLREQAAQKKASAMLLKSLYLLGHSVDKNTFRALFAEGEAQIAAGPISSMSRFSRQAIAAFPVKTWRDQRRDNYNAFAQAFAPQAGLRLLPAQTDEATPFSCVLVVDDPQKRDLLRAALIAQAIYPAVLWDLDEARLSGVGQEDKNLGRCILSLHCDQRYGDKDMIGLAIFIAESYGENTCQ